MKNFFYFFIGFCWVLCATIGRADAFSWDDIGTELRTGRKKMYQGADSWQPVPFGRVRLMSCRTGVQGSTSVLTGLLIDGSADMSVRPPLLTWDADSPWQGLVLTPLNRDKPETEPWAETYSLPQLFPIVWTGRPDQDARIRLTAEWTACPKEGPCQTAQTTHALDLPATESYPTAWCGFLSDASRFGALPVDKSHISIRGVILPNGTGQVQMTLPTTPKWFDVQPADWAADWHVISKQTDGQTLGFTLRPGAQALRENDTLSFYIRSNAGYYRATVQMMTEPLPVPARSVPLGRMLWAGLLLFWVSPWACLWLAPHRWTTSGPDLARKSRWIQGISVLVWTGWLLCAQRGLVADAGVPGLSGTIGLMILLIILIIRPILPMAIAGLCFCVLPKVAMPAVSGGDLTDMLCLWLWGSICLVIPWNLWKMAARPVRAFLTRADQSPEWGYQLTLRLPYLILLMWLGAALIGSRISPQDSPFDRHAIVRPAVVRVVPEVCLSCVRDNWTVYDFIRHRMQVYQLTATDPLARMWQRQHGLQDRTFSVLLLPDGRQILVPLDLNLKTADAFLNKYLTKTPSPESVKETDTNPVVDTPSDPRVHSPDDPHVP